MSIASTILQQLGGGKFVAMTGAKNLMDIGNGLSMQIGRNHRGINRVKVILDADDTYTVKFGRYAKLEVKPVAEVSGVYCDQLQDIFTAETGMYTHL